MNLWSHHFNQSHYREVPRWVIFMEQELRFGLDLGQLALLKKKHIWANYEQLLRPVFSLFGGQNFFLIFFLTPKKWKNGPQKLLIIGPDPFIPQSSPGHSPQPKIDPPYHEISGPDICSLICELKDGKSHSDVTCELLF